MSDTREKGRILIVDDEQSMRTMLSIALKKDGHVVDEVADGATALQLFDENDYDLVIQDNKMPGGMDGIELLCHIKERDERMQVIIMTAFSTWDTAVEAMRLGAYDYIKKPFDNDEVRALVQRALSQRRILSATSSEMSVEQHTLIGSTTAIQEIFDLVKRVAPTDSTVVIQGESGTGKELVAHLIHLHSLRAHEPFVSVNCGAFTETLLESELFGHARGAFTGAVADKKGLLAVADGGTFFLDELGEMSLPTQVHFLKVLESRQFLPVGAMQTQRSDVRFVTATNRDLEAMVENGTFREDLFYRLNVIPIHLPPLRERRDDIPLLAGHFLARYARVQNKRVTGFDPAASELLRNRDWPGNVRELENTIQRAVTLSTGERITTEDLTRGVSAHGPHHAEPAAEENGVVIPEDGSFDLEARMADIERRYLEAALDASGGNMTRAAEMLGISFRSMRYKVKKLRVST